MKPGRDSQLAHRRLQTSQDHLKAADALLAADLPAHACFAAYQCGEDAMEALWRLAGADPWGHSLAELVAKLPQQEDVPAFAMWLEEARRLDRFFNGFRSSTGLHDSTPYQVYSNVEAQGAIDRARYLLDGARQIVALEEAKSFDSSDGDAGWSHRRPGHACGRGRGWAAQIIASAIEPSGLAERPGCWHQRSPCPVASRVL